MLIEKHYFFFTIFLLNRFLDSIQFLLNELCMKYVRITKTGNYFHKTLYSSQLFFLFFFFCSRSCVCVCVWVCCRFRYEYVVKRVWRVSLFSEQVSNLTLEYSKSIAHQRKKNNNNTTKQMREKYVERTNKHKKKCNMHMIPCNWASWKVFQICVVQS